MTGAASSTAGEANNQGVPNTTGKKDAIGGRYIIKEMDSAGSRAIDKVKNGVNGKDEQVGMVQEKPKKKQHSEAGNGAAFGLTDKVKGAFPFPSALSSTWEPNLHQLKNRSY
jgi:hypothetical protein